MRQAGVEVSDTLLPGLELVDEEGTPGEVDDHRHQSLVQRYGGLSEPANALLVSEGFAKDLSEGKPHVLYGVMLIDGQITGRADHQIEEAVLAPEFEHVVEEGHSGRDRGRPAAIEVEFDEDAGLPRRPLDRRLAGG